MVRFIIIASAVIYFLQSMSLVDGFVPFSPIAQRRVKSVDAPAARLPTVEQRAFPIASVNLGVDTTSLTKFFLETLISSGVPAVFVIVIIGFAAKSIKNAKDTGKQGPNGGLFGKTAVTDLYDDLYGPSGGGQKALFPFQRGAQKTIPKNLGIPSTEFLKITKLNSKYESFDFSLTAATQSKAKAAAKFRSQAFNSALQRSFDSSITELNSAQKSDLLTEEKAFLTQGSDILNSIIELQRQLTELVISEEMKSMDVDLGEVDAYDKDGKKIVDATIVKEEKDSKITVKDTKNKKSDKKTLNKLVKEIQKLNTDLLKLEMEFIRAVVEIMGSDRANAIRAAILGNINGGGAGVAGGLIKSLQDRPLSAILKTIGYSDDGESSSRNLFVTDFPGDVSASQVATLREEVTAIIRAAKPGDEALLTLQTGGGTVTGYGLAAAQLQRFKKHGMKLTICVEQVAASGGYMMSCVGDRIIASPFAVLGSIGVISDLPNVYERLKREGIEFQTVTAGKYKRTLTPTKKVTDEDLAKSKEDIEQILKLFKAFVKDNRPSLDIDKVATGETWFGDDALEKGLCDELGTVDDVLCQFVDDGYNVYQVAYDPTVSDSPLAGLLPIGADNAGTKSSGLVKSMTRWVVGNIGSAVREEFANDFQSKSGSNVEERYMVKDPRDSSDNIKF